MHILIADSDNMLVNKSGENKEIVFFHEVTAFKNTISYWELYRSIKQYADLKLSLLEISEI